MKRVIYYLFVLAAMSCSLTSCNSSDDDLGNESIVPPLETVTITDTRKSIATEMLTIPYHELAFSTSGNTEKPCLVIYLHGGTGNGDDNEKQMEEAGIGSISNYLKAHQKNAVFLIPQCPNRQYWIGPAKNVLGELIDQYVADGKVDAKQIYLFGGSMGGTGTWDMLATYPNLFAAAMPVAGDPTKAGEYNSSTPVFTVMGTEDDLMDMFTAQSFVEQLKAQNVDARIEIEEGWTHEMTCIESYTTSRLDWVFSHGSF